MANNDIIVSEMTPASQINTGDLMIMTQPDAQSETGYSTKSGTVLQVSNKMLKGTNYETDLPSFANKNVLGGMEELKGDIFNLLPVDEASGSIANFETELAAPLHSVLVNVEATGGNGTPDSPNPINGYTAVNLTAYTGPNIWDEQWVLENGRITSKNYIKVLPSTRYFFVNTNLYDITMYDSDYTSLGHPSYGSRPGGFVFQTAATCAWIKFDLGSPYGTTYLNDVSINYPETETTYNAYTGNAYAVSFGQTVYGGVLDVTRGKLRVTHVGSEVLSTWNWNVSGSFPGSFYTSINVVGAKPYTPFLCTHAVAVTNTSDYVYGKCYCDSAINLRLMAEGSSLQDWKDYLDAQKLANTPVFIVCELATPFDIDLTPVQINALLGVNNVYNDTNGDTEVKYKEGIQHYIDKKIAATQALIL